MTPLPPPVRGEGVIRVLSCCGIIIYKALNKRGELNMKRLLLRKLLKRKQSPAAIIKLIKNLKAGEELEIYCCDWIPVKNFRSGETYRPSSTIEFLRSRIPSIYGPGVFTTTHVNKKAAIKRIRPPYAVSNVDRRKQKPAQKVGSRSVFAFQLADQLNRSIGNLAISNSERGTEGTLNYETWSLCNQCGHTGESQSEIRHSGTCPVGWFQDLASDVINPEYKESN